MDFAHVVTILVTPPISDTNEMEDSSAGRHVSMSGPYIGFPGH
jgi:hypothetical protein